MKSKNLISRCFDCAQHDKNNRSFWNEQSEVIESLKNGLNYFLEEILSLTLQDDKASQ